jgi:propanol-preferring alcohol dehydrogenase
LGHTCGLCRFCRADQENLCDTPLFTGYSINGGFAEYAIADASYCFAIPDTYSDTAAAPLLCAGLIGHRALRMSANAHKLGIYGFGAAAHIVAQVAQFEQRTVYAFTRPGDAQAQALPAVSVAFGPATPTNGRTWSWMPRSSLRLSVD